jgi:3-oxoacyl-[acyl-carrier protein] reductase
MPERILLVGASRGIGGTAALHLAAKGADLLAVSRGPAMAGTWVQADVGTSAGLETVAAAVGDRPLDALLYLGGIWEAGAFTEDYRFAGSSEAETRAVIGVNLVAPVELARKLAAPLAAAANPRVVMIGSLSGLPGRGSAEVANTAAKFGLQGAAEALRLSFRGTGIGVTVINPGNVATPEVEADIAEGRFGAQVPVPMADLLAALDAVLAMSRASEIETLNLAQRFPG